MRLQRNNQLVDKRTPNEVSSTFEGVFDFTNMEKTDISIRKLELFKNRQIRTAIGIIRKELCKRNISLNGVKNPDATIIYAREVCGEEIIDYKDWVFNKVESGYFKKYKLDKNTNRLRVSDNNWKRKLNKTKKVKKPNKQTYDEFLKSAYWRKVRLAILKRDNKHCCSCGSTDDLHIHHLTYKHHLKELDNLDDLVTLCKKCHNEIHGRVNGVNTIPLGEYETSYDIAKAK